MKFGQLLKLVGDSPVFESNLLLAGDIDPQIVRLQLGRWTKNGLIYQLRRGLYAIASPYQKTKPHPFQIANSLKRASYVSAQSALAFYGMIPDIVNVTISFTSGRPEMIETPLGSFQFRHIKTHLLTGYHMTSLGDQGALIASPEKALLDLIYLQTGGEQINFIRELRLQNLDHLHLDTLWTYVDVFSSPKMHRAGVVIANLIQESAGELEII